ncbi:MAG: class I SAM-dependent methyltransferase [Geobacter sp.]|nr:class I SAM-dependent methyltransferase [Geobacter sp.]
MTLETKLCPLGCSPNEILILTGEDLLHNIPGKFPVVKCLTCGLVRTDPRPSPEAIGFYYPDSYGPYSGTRITDGKGEAGRKTRWHHLLRRFADFRTNSIPPLPPGRMLEIGCASGSFLHRMASEGWSVTGIELSEHAAAAARSLGFPVYAGKVESVPEPSEPYDLVVGWMVLEHLHDPVDTLEQIRKWVRPGGWLAISTPDISAVEFRLFKERWYALHLPNHLFHFSRGTITKVLQKGGWDVKKIMGQRVITNILGSIGLVLLKGCPDSKLGRLFLSLPTAGLWLNVILYPVSCVMARLGQTGCMTVWAQRP